MELTLAVAQLAASDTVFDGWIHSFGNYVPRRSARKHRNSAWSRAVIMAKHRYEGVCQVFGHMVADHLMQLLCDGHQWVVTHVPAEQDRGWLFTDMGRCATEMLATCIWKELSQHMDVVIEPLLVQTRQKIKGQHQCAGTAERFANVQGLYALAEGKQVFGRRIMLVDDVMTSGATMNECARVLRDGGAAEILGVALARTVHPASSSPLGQQS